LIPQVKSNPFNFESSKKLRGLIEMLPDGGAQWMSTTITPKYGVTKHQVDLLYRDPISVVQQLLRTPALQEMLTFMPKKVWDSQRVSRQYSEMWTGDYWWDTQVRLFANMNVH